jgi:hypothetical protein
MHALRLTFRVATLGTLLAGVALAAHPGEPRRAAKLQINLVRGYQPCTLPNDSTTGAFLFNACTPPVPNDTVCDGFASGGVGSVQLFTVGGVFSNNGNLRIKGKAVHLTPGCEGQILCPVLSFRLTTDGCVNGTGPGCTAVDQTDKQIGFPATAGCCTVTGGACSFATLLNTQIPGAVSSGKGMGFEVRGCGLRRVSGPAPLGAALTCGLLVP